MRPPLRWLAPLVLLLAGLAPAAQATVASLVADLTPGDAEPSPASSRPGGFVTLGDRVVFCAAEGSSFNAINSFFSTDGTDVGTRRVLPSCPLESFPRPTLLPNAAQPRLQLWTAPDADTECNARQLWVTDGTPEGTRQLTHCPSGALILATEAGRAYYAAIDPDGTWSVASTDGTPAGTRRVADFATPTSRTWPRLAGFLGTHAYFFTTEEDRSETLWRVALPSGTPTVVRSGLELFSLPTRRGTASRFYFVAFTGGKQELWTSDGTAGGTRPISQFREDLFLGSSDWLAASGDRLYFMASEPDRGRQLWATDGATPRRLTDLRPPSTVRVGGPPEAWLAGDRALLRLSAPNSGSSELWVSSGTAATTQRLLPTCGNACPPDEGLVGTLSQVGERVFFPHRTPERGTELWTSDGTVAGSRLVADLCPGPCGGVRSLEAQADELLFVGFDPARRFELYTTDAAASPPRRLTNLAAPEAFNDFLSFTSLSVRQGERIFFQGLDATHGLEPWVTDPDAPEGARLITDLVRGPGSSAIRSFTSVGASVLFLKRATDENEVWSVPSPGSAPVRLGNLADSFCFGVSDCRLPVAGSRAFWTRPSDEAFTVDLVASDGTPAGTRTVFQGTAAQAYQGVWGTLGAELFFLVFDSSGETVRRFVWSSDGSPGGTRARMELPADVPSSVLSAAAVGEAIWFFARSEFSSTELELWRTDGTTAGTRRLETLAIQPQESRAPTVVPLGELGVFQILGPNQVPQLWASDGSVGGAVLLDPEGALGLGGAALDSAAALGDELFFVARSDQRDLVGATDGTPAGTRVVAELPGDTDTLHVNSVATVSNRVVFVAVDPETGPEPWVSDGTTTGTRLLRDVNPGFRGSGPANLTAASGRVWFTADDGLHGRELWVTDGTPEGTRLAHDLFPGPVGGPGERNNSLEDVRLGVAGDRLYLAADDGLTGYELWSLPLAPTGPVCADAPNGLCLQGNRFRAEVVWQDFAGNRGVGRPAPITADTGYFWFFDPGNIEIVTKQLDGRALNDHFWTFYAALSNVEYHLTLTDTETGLTRRFFNPPGLLASVADTESFGPRGADLASFTAPAPAESQAAVFEAAASFAPRAASGTCTPSATTLCLADGRFAVEVAWTDFQGNQGTGQTRTLTGDTGAFWFFAPDNVEVVLKVLDGTALNGKFWVFYGALSNVEYRLTVTDTTTGTAKTYTNPSGRLASVADTGAF